MTITRADYWKECTPTNECEQREDHICINNCTHWVWVPTDQKPEIEECCSDGYDNDCDGYTDCNDTDCSCLSVCDNIVPTTTISPDGTSWVNYDVSFDLSCNDNCGCLETKYSIKNFDETCPSYDQLENTGNSDTIACPSNSFCKKVVCFASKDINGNVENVKRSNEFKIDKTLPLGDIQISPTEPTDKDTVTYTATGSDTGSGLSRIEIYVDDELKRSCVITSVSPGMEEECSYSEGPYEGDSTHSYYAKFYDKAGNVNSTGIKTFTVIKTKCDSDADCDDNNPCTIDTCINPGTDNSYCNYTNQQCGYSCSINGKAGICDGEGNCYTNVTTCTLNCTVPDAGQNFERYLTGNCGRDSVYKSGDDKVCDLTSCIQTSSSIVISGGYDSIQYPSGTYHPGDVIKITVKGIYATEGWTPLTECKLVKSDGSGIYFDYWGTGDHTFSYTVKDDDPTGTWKIEYCGVWSDFEANNGWVLKVDRETRTFNVSGYTCNYNGRCEKYETQDSCSSDCKTVLILPKRTVFPGQRISLTVEFNDSRFHYSQGNFSNVRLILQFYTPEEVFIMNWSDCKVHAINWSEIVRECNMNWGEFNEYDCKGTKIVLAEGYGRISFNCTIPKDLEIGEYILKVTPVIYSKPKILMPGVARIKVVKSFNPLINFFYYFFKLFGLTR